MADSKKAAEVKTGTKGQEQQAPSMFVDFRKSNKTVIKIGNVEIMIIGVLTKETKKSCWIHKARVIGTEEWKDVSFCGGRTDSKGAYCSSKIKAICSEAGEKEVYEAATV